ncbi:unnamed protein product [Vitrella brassicaformis CCMP3155]|uniref:UBC core domain-containing protein n=2 Tax=Vitrella brassicaformis TaxID=1169539 RepID=A0A0G4GD48_VITBC|nr:unnamed protein product [Vitrella brassicaformis CCMP3155]|eukprot:CEM27188.1 unnamed protein product [Vitrella brassicaformis CCMP3155]
MSGPSHRTTTGNVPVTVPRLPLGQHHHAPLSHRHMAHQHQQPQQQQQPGPPDGVAGTSALVDLLTTARRHRVAESRIVGQYQELPVDRSGVGRAVDGWRSVKENIRKYAVVVEYKHLKEHCPEGVYVFPSFDHFGTWYGVLFAHAGPYKGGAFQFNVEIPDGYPEEAPVFTFTPPIFHPFVDPHTGKVDISPAFPRWCLGHDYIALALSFLKKMVFCDPHLMTMGREPHNQARDMFLNDKGSFLSEAERTVREADVYTHTNDTLKFCPWSEERHGPIAEAIRDPPPLPAEGQSPAHAEGAEEPYAVNGHATRFVEWLLRMVEDGVSHSQQQQQQQHQQQQQQQESGQGAAQMGAGEVQQ